MRLLAEYKANSKLEPPPEEEEAKDKRGAKAGTDRQSERLRGEESEFSSISSISSDGSLLVSPVG